MFYGRLGERHSTLSDTWKENNNNGFSDMGLSYSELGLGAQKILALWQLGIRVAWHWA